MRPALAAEGVGEASKAAARRELVCPSRRYLAGGTIMSKHINDQKLNSQPHQPVFDVVEHCIRHSISSKDQGKLLSLLGKFASRHELETNAPPKRPRFR
ncbi:hypothetical protein ASD00_04540 [Ensifer sp. Root31]|nr:hypothetical protein ASD00_04540 [Ensifer sp. Root31]